MSPVSHLPNPEDDYLPGIKDSVIHDCESDARDIFQEETAGLSEGPAELLGLSADTSGRPVKSASRRHERERAKSDSSAKI